MKKLLPVLALGAGAALILTGTKKRPKNRGLPEGKGADESAQIYVFEASWCAICKETKPALLEVAKRHPDIPFRFVDVDLEKSLAEEFDVSLIPTVIAIVNGEIVRRVEGRGKLSDYEDLAEHAKNVASGAIPLPPPESEKKKLPSGA